MKKEKSCGVIPFCSIGNENRVILIKQNNGVVGFPKGHVEINETEYNIREQNEVYNTDDIFYNKLKAVQYTKDPLGDLASANSAIIYYGYSNCSLRCCIPCILSCNCSCNCSCSEIYKYNSFVKIGDFEKFLFTNLAYLDCGIDKSCRFNKCTNLTFSSYNDYCTNNGIQFSYMDKNKECTACGFCESLLKVYLTKENKLVGIVKFRGYCEECICCKDKCNLSVENFALVMIIHIVVKF